jgi:Putative Ig domain
MKFNIGDGEMRNNKLPLMASLFSLVLLCFGVIGDAAAASGIIYAQNPVIGSPGYLITPDRASCNGTLSKVSVTPALPDGLTIDPTSGTVSGVPTQIVDSTAYTVSAQCSGASVTGVLTLGVGDAPTAYYVDDVNGNDGANGHTPATAWKSLAKVNSVAFGPNTSVRFKRGGVWRGQLRLRNGSPAGAIYYDAYGTGLNPVLMGSVSKANTSDWTALGGNLWQSAATFRPQAGYTNGLPYNNANDVGNIIWGGTTNTSTGMMKATQSDLQKPGDWIFRTTDYRVVVYSTSNPATAFPGLELAIDADILEANNLGQSYAYVQHFTLRYGGASGYNGNGVLSSHVTFRDLDISYIGGGNLGGKGIRYGTGITFWGNAHDNLVERCRIWQIFDSGFTNQSSGTNISVYNITYRNNIVWNSSTGIEIWLHPSDSGASSTMHDIRVLNNTIVNPGGSGGWAVGQHFGNGNGGFGVNIGTPAGVTVYNIVIKNNVIAYMANNALIEDQSFSMWTGVMTMNYNDWFHPVTPPMVHQAVPTFLDEPLKTWATNFPAEQHGIEVEPKFVNLATGNFHLGTGSPLINAGENYYVGGVLLDFDRKPRPATGAFDIGAYQH